MHTADWQRARSGRGRLTLQELIQYPADKGMNINHGNGRQNTVFKILKKSKPEYCRKTAE
jgi:hypothetical protein